MSEGGYVARPPLPPSAVKAYAARTYTDAKGTQWRRGMDGWFEEWPDGTIHMIHHHEMFDLIRKEHPDESE